MARDTTAAIRSKKIGVMDSCWLNLTEPSPPTRCYPEGSAIRGMGYLVRGGSPKPLTES